MARIQEVQSCRPTVKRRFGFPPNDLRAGAVDLTNQRPVRRPAQISIPTPGSCAGLQGRDDGLSASTVSADDVNTQLGAVAGEGSGKDPDNV